MTSKLAFVTGAAGFLGRNLLEVLLEEGWQVHVLLRHQAPAWMKTQTGLHISAGALEDAAALARAMPSACDAVFHLAANTSSWVGDAAAIHRDNVQATQNVAAAALSAGAKRLIATSTLGIFDARHGRISEGTPLLKAEHPNPYLRSKLQADRLLTQAHEHGSLSVVQMHPGHILGRYDRSGWISLFDQLQAGKLGAAPRGRASFCLASDVALAHVRAAKRSEPHMRYILSSADASYQEFFNGIRASMGKPPSANQVPAGVLKAVARVSQWASQISGKAPSITPGLAALLSSDLLGDAKLARQELGFPETNLATMLEETAGFWQQAQQAAGNQR